LETTQEFLNGKLEDEKDAKLAEITRDDAGDEIDVGNTWPNSFFTRLRILIGYTQICSALNMTFSIPWPVEFEQFLNVLSTINLNFIDLLSPISPCALTTPFMTTSIVHMCVLPACLIIVLAAEAITLLFLWQKYHSKTKRKQARGIVRAHAIQTVLFVVFLLYPGIGTRIFRSFKCQTIGKTKWLVADYSIVCWEGMHLTYSYFMAGCGVVFVIGIPLFCLVVLCQKRHLIVGKISKQDTDKNNRKYLQDSLGSLYMDYNPHLWYFESIEMIKKMILAGGLVLVAPGSAVQVLLGILVAFAFLVVVLQYQPYDDANDNNLQAYATAQIVLTLLAGLMLKTGGSGEDSGGEYEQGLMTILLIGINCSVLVIGFFLLILLFPCFGHGKSRTHQTAVLHAGILKRDIFEHLPRNSLKQILRRMESVEWPKKKNTEGKKKIGSLNSGEILAWQKRGEVIFEQGDDAEFMLLITKGKVNIFIAEKDADKKGKFKRTMAAPVMIGLDALVSDAHKRTARVECCTKTVQALKLTRKHFKLLVAQDVLNAEFSLKATKTANKKRDSKVYPVLWKQKNSTANGAVSKTTDSEQHDALRIVSRTELHEEEIDQIHKEHDEHDQRLRKKHEMLRKKTQNRVQERRRARTALSHSRTLQKTKLFHDLPVDAIAKIINVMELRTFEISENLVIQGDPASEFMVIMKGAATVFCDGAKVRHLGSLDFLGEGALVNEHHVRGATVTADTPSSVLVLSFDRYQELLVDGTIAEETHERASRMSRSYTAEDAKRAQEAFHLNH
jgi:CRP-like cAMP-binding protein